MNELTENKQNLPVSSDSETMPVPAPGKTLYITQDTKGFDYRSILGQVVQYVNMGDVLTKIKAGTQYVVQIPAEFQKAYLSYRERLTNRQFQV